MEKKIYKAMEEWADSLNEWERLFWSYLVYADFRIEPNENISEDFPNKYWIVDNQLVWDSEPCNSVVDVFESHPTIVEEFLDNLYEEAEEYDFPEVVGDEIGYHGWEAGYWAWLFNHKEDADLEPGVKQFLNNHSWECEICDLMAFHAEEVDVEKFV